jgi:hypothetical protein
MLPGRNPGESDDDYAARIPAEDILRSLARGWGMSATYNKSFKTLF